MAKAANQDTELRLNQAIEQRAVSQERALLESSVPTGPDAPLLELDGQYYGIGNTVDELGAAVYLSIERKQWPAASDYLARYTALPEHDPMLIAYAHGALARTKGNLELAESYYRELLTMQSDFLPGQLELARVLFESRKDRESTSAFQQIRAELDASDARAMGLGRSVDSFLEVLDERERWHGSLAVGPIWASNLNQSSEGVHTLYSFFGPLTYKQPKAVSAQGIDYEATLSKRLPVSNHHGIYLRSLLYGQHYKNTSLYNVSTLTNNIGYSYHGPRDQYAFGPTFELNTHGDETLYKAWGLHGEWQRVLSSTRMFKLEGDYKKIAFQQTVHDYLNGNMSTLFATLWQALPYQWMLFGGGDLAVRNTQYRTNDYFQKGLRLGVAKEFDMGVSAVLFTSYRQRQYDGYNAWLGDRRNEDEQSYTLSVRAPRLAIYGAVPSLTAKYYQNKSNIDWAYSYDNNSVSLKLEKQF
ncbi:surface lipoprotein assembly modifier [Pseudomonas plecoglossicida]|uniref:surface lipoprotein assembly modifier n=1 Tax=Pseudomonas plecoglossicida TaxID=70775 RepID=UPI0003A6E624|nr:surface lipoprotein assembly modifier [Pseudomonas plecoglossicida]